MSCQTILRGPVADFHAGDSIFWLGCLVDEDDNPVSLDGVTIQAQIRQMGVVGPNGLLLATLSPVIYNQTYLRGFFSLKSSLDTAAWSTTTILVVDVEFRKNGARLSSVTFGLKVYREVTLWQN